MMSSTIIKKSNPFIPSLNSLGHQFLQRCSVSGTAKGKGKTKDAQPLKRSKVTVKKGSPLPDSSKKEGPRKHSQFDEMVDQCLTSTSPLRFMKPKEKAREAEREKMGLITKSNEQAKQKLKKQGDEFSSPWIMGTPGMDLITLGLVDADKIPKYELNVEDGRKLAKEYSRVLMRKHRARQAAESTFLRCKKEAIEALPEDLKAQALVPDLSPFPMNRFMATLTPPIEGYIEKINEAARRSAAKGKLR
ncbi:hypothetical protein OROGR_003869 [Orobanche gracilis]